MRKFTLLLLINLPLLGYYYLQSEEVGQEPLDTQVLLPAVSRQMKLMAAPMAKAMVEPEAQYLDLFQSAGLSKEKSEAMLDLDKFHRSRPALTEENMRMRHEFLRVLNESSGETLAAFHELLKNTSSQEDELRTFLMNITMAMDVSDEAKASIFVTRAFSGADFREDGSIEDSDLSLAISFSHLSRLADSKVKSQALAEIKSHRKLMNSKGFQQLLQDYFPASNQSP